jgi:hypothetical protein
MMSHDVPLGFRCQGLIQVKYASGVAVVASDRAGFQPDHGSITILRILRNFLLRDTTSHLQQDCSESLKHGHIFSSNKGIFEQLLYRTAKPLNHESDGFSAY